MYLPDNQLSEFFATVAQVAGIGVNVLIDIIIRNKCYLNLFRYKLF